MCWKLWILGFAFVSLKQVLLLVAQIIDNNKSQDTPFICLCTIGFRHFPMSNRNGNLKLTFGKHNLNLISTLPCSSVVLYCLKQLTAFLPCSVPVSAFAFRLGRWFTALSYGVVPTLQNNIMPYLGAHPIRLLPFNLPPFHILSLRQWRNDEILYRSRSPHTAYPLWSYRLLAELLSVPFFACYSSSL